MRKNSFLKFIQKNILVCSLFILLIGFHFFDKGIFVFELNQSNLFRLNVEKNINLKTELSQGEMGKPVALPQNVSKKLKELIEGDEEQYGYNEFASDLISLNRTLPDYRNEKCTVIYDGDELYPFNNDFLDIPVSTATVIIVFRDEAWSTLMRTVHSVLYRSLLHLLVDIILVDNGSTKAHLKGHLENYLKQKRYKKIRLLRTYKRLGTWEARCLAADKAIGMVLIFLDSCCECTEGWLQPILRRLIVSQRMVAVPAIDKINPKTFEYQSQGLTKLLKGGFDWNLRHVMYQIFLKNNSIDPIKTPVISHGIFAINKAFFYEITDLEYYPYDTDLSDLEISFHIWMCGGRIEILPCSRIGYIFRKSMLVNPVDEDEFTLVQKSRLAEKWMGEFKEYFYQRKGNNLIKIGEIEKDKSRKQKLNCKSFKWYLNYVNTELKVIESNFSGELKYLKGSGKLCLDSPTDPKSLYIPLKLYPCHGKGRNQFWIFSKDGKITRDGSCVSYHHKNVFLSPCYHKNMDQTWSYDHDTKQIRCKKTRKCLSASLDDNKVLRLLNCPVLNEQTWIFNRYNYTIFY